MPKELIFIQAVPCDTYYIFQTHVWLESLRSIGKSDKAINLIFTPNDRVRNPKWDELKKLYPESEFFFYRDSDNITKDITIYMSIIRPYILMKYFEFHPELKDKAIFYCDADIVFTENFNIDHLVDDDICYVSNTLGYINASYFDSKIRDVKPEMLEEYKKIDVLDIACSLVGVSRETAEKNNLHSGGAQYLLKNVDSIFWKKMITDTLNLRKYLMSVNRAYFSSEDKGFQSWCSDMWALLWGLWYQNKEVKVVPEMDFAHAADSILKLEKIGIYHNAGAVSDKIEDIPVFYKGKYISRINPFKDPYLDLVYNNEKSKTLANWFYVKKLIELREKYEIKYYG